MDGVLKLGSISIQMTSKALRMDGTITRDEGSTFSGAWITATLGSGGGRRSLHWRMRTDQGYKKKAWWWVRSHWKRICGWRFLSALKL